MRKSRSIIALLTALAFVLSFSLVAAAAPSFDTEAFTDVDADSDAADAFALLRSLDIFEGYGDGTVGPNDTLTREQFAAVVVRAMGQANTANLLSNTATAFTDDASITWSRGFVMLAVANGIINGYPDGSFRPQANVTFAEAFAMLTRALGLDGAATGPWPANYIALAGRIGLNEGLSTQANVAMTRSEMAIATENAMHASWTWDAEKGKLTNDKDQTPPVDNSWFTADHSTGKGNLEAATSTWLQINVESGEDAGKVKKYDLADNVLLFGAQAPSDLLGKKVKFTLVNGKLAYLSAEEETKVTVTEGLITKKDTTTVEGQVRLTLDRGEIVTLDEDTAIVRDGADAKASTLLEGDYVRVRVESEKAKVTAYTFDNPVVVGYEELQTGLGITKVTLEEEPRTKSSITVYKKNGSAWDKVPRTGAGAWAWAGAGTKDITGLKENGTYIVSYDPKLAAVTTVMGATTGLSGIRAGDVVYKNSGGVPNDAIYVVRDTVTGKVSKVEQLTDEDRITVGERSLYAKEGNKLDGGNDINTDSEGHFRVGLAGNVIDLHTSVTTVAAKGDYGVQRAAGTDGSGDYITLEAFGETKTIRVDDTKADRDNNDKLVMAVANGEVTKLADDVDAEVISIVGDVMQLDVGGNPRIINITNTPIFTRDTSDDDKLASGSFSGIKVGDEIRVIEDGNKVVIVILEK